MEGFDHGSALSIFLLLSGGGPPDLASCEWIIVYNNHLLPTIRSGGSGG
jgi:hypothetical protein